MRKTKIAKIKEMTRRSIEIKLAKISQEIRREATKRAFKVCVVQSEEQERAICNEFKSDKDARVVLIKCY